MFKNGANYMGAIAGIRLGKSQKKGTPCIEVTVTIERDVAGNELEFIEERMIPVWVTPNTMDMVKQFLDSIGFDRKKLSEIDERHKNAFDSEGRQVTLRCKHERYTNDDGEEKTSVKFEFNYGAPKFTEDINKADIAELDNMFAGVLAGNKGGGVKAKAKAAVAERSEEEDIPF